MLYRQPKEKNPKKDTYYIFTNGETEAIYFSLIKETFVDLLNGRKIEIKKLKKGNAHYLIEQIVEQREQLKSCNQIWCVFDCDNKQNNETGQNTEDIFRKAFELANKNKIYIGFSNMAIEYWLLSHYVYQTQSMDNSQLTSRLTNILGKKYNKTDKKFFKKHFIQNERIKKAISCGDQNWQEKMRRFKKDLKEEINLSKQYFQEIYKYPIWEWNSFSNLFELMRELGW